MNVVLKDVYCKFSETHFIEQRRCINKNCGDNVETKARLIKLRQRKRREMAKQIEITKKDDVFQTHQ